MAKSMATFSPVGNCSYLYIAGYSDQSTEVPNRAPVLTDEANADEDGTLQAGNMPKLTEDDNHGDKFRVVLYLDGHVGTIEDGNAANAIFAALQNTTILNSVD